jgi:hypothetical protein
VTASFGRVPGAGLCDQCRHQQVVRNTRGVRGTSRALLRRKRIQDDEVAAVLGLLELL